MSSKESTKVTFGDVLASCNQFGVPSKVTISGYTLAEKAKDCWDRDS